MGPDCMNDRMRGRRANGVRPGNVRTMPDQSSASTEHAIMQEITAPLATLPDDPVPAVADVDFSVVLRGYDREAVDAYVRRTSQLVAELQTTRSPEAAIRRALERVGEEVSGILQRAHDTAAQITAQSRSEAEDRLEAARREEADIVARAEERVRELDAETDRIWAERHRIVEDTRELARELLAVTDSAADRFPPDPAAADPSAPDGPSAALLPEEDVRAEAPPVEVPDEDALPDEVATGEQDADGGPRRGANRDPPGPRAARGRHRGQIAAGSAMAGMRLIDVMHLGRPRVIGSWVVGDVVVDPGPTSCLDTLLAGLGGERPRALLLTHIHLDHAGASGSLVERWPDLEVYVHERGARHMASPDRLIESARQLYGDDMDRLWGEMVAGPRVEPAGRARWRDAVRRRVRGRLYAGARLPPRLVPARRGRLRRRHGRRADRRIAADDSAQPTARHRRREVA